MLRRPAPVACLLIALTTVGCTTMQSIQQEAPSYVVDYSGVDRADLASCVVTRLERKTSYYNRLIDGSEYLTVESSVSAFIPGGAILLEAEGAVPYFATRIYADRVEIYGRFSVWGDHGKVVIRFVKECAAELGGTSAERPRK